MIRAECEKCGKVVNVPDSYAGGEGKCKRCGWRVNIPLPGQQRPGTPAVNPADTSGADALGAIAYAADHPEAANTSSGAPRPIRTRKKKSNTGMLVAAWMIAVFLLVLIGVAIYAAKWHEKELVDPSNPEIRYVKPD